MVDLGSEYLIGRATIYVRGDCCADRLHDFNVGGLDRMLAANENVDPFSYPVCHFYPGAVSTGAVVEITCSDVIQTRYVIIQVS